MIAAEALAADFDGMQSPLWVQRDNRDHNWGKTGGGLREALMAIDWGDIDHGKWECVEIDGKYEAVLEATKRAGAADAAKKADPAAPGASPKDQATIAAHEKTQLGAAQNTQAAQAKEDGAAKGGAAAAGASAGADAAKPADIGATAKPAEMKPADAGSSAPNAGGGPKPVDAGTSGKASDAAAGPKPAGGGGASAAAAAATDAKKASAEPVQVPFAMKGTPHHLIIHPDGKIEMASQVGLLKSKATKLAADLSKIDPPPATEVGAIQRIEAAADALDQKLSANRDMLASNSAEAQTLVQAIVDYGRDFDATDLDIMADSATPLRQSAGYKWLAAHGWAVDLETRILNHPTEFSRSYVKTILDQIGKWSTVPGFEAKVQKAIGTNTFWSPNRGTFWEIAGLASLSDIKVVDVQVGTKNIDTLTAAGLLVDHKSDVNLDLTDPTNPQLDARLMGQISAMQAAVGTTIEGIVVTDWRILTKGAVSPDVQAVIDKLGFTTKFMQG